jgi:multicomponent Na+:H+ antiporter subunit D
VPIFYRAFFKAPVINLDEYKEAPLTMVVPLCFTAVMSVLLGFFPQLFQDFIRVFGSY